MRPRGNAKSWAMSAARKPISYSKRKKKKGSNYWKQGGQGLQARSEWARDKAGQNKWKGSGQHYRRRRYFIAARKYR